MYVHKFPIDADDWKTLQNYMDRLFEKPPKQSFWARLLCCAYRSRVKKGVRVRQLMYHTFPDAYRKRLLVLVYKYLDRVHGCHYRVPDSVFECLQSVLATRIEATDAVKIATYQVLHTENENFTHDVVTIVFYVRKTVSGCDLRIRLPGDILRTLVVDAGDAVVLSGNVVHGAGSGFGPGVRECFVVNVPISIKNR